MRKSIAILITLFVVFTGTLIFAEQQKEKSKIITPEIFWKQQQEFKDSLSKGSVGRFQATKLDTNAMFIIDTKEGHLWAWIIQIDKEGRRGEFLIYQGRVLPGSKMSDVISTTSVSH